MGEIKVGLLLQGRVVGTDDGCDGFDIEEKVLIDTSHYTVRRCRHGGKWLSTPFRRDDNTVAG